MVRRALNSNDAAITMQRLGRMVRLKYYNLVFESYFFIEQFVSKLRVTRRRQRMRDEKEARNNAGLKIKIFLLVKMRLYKSKLTGDALKT